MLEADRGLEHLGIEGQEEMLDLGVVSGARNDHIVNLITFDKYNVYAGITALLCDEIYQAQNTVASLSLEKERFTQEMQVIHPSISRDIFNGPI